MDEPKLVKKEKINLSFFKKNIYLIVLGLLFLLGTSYSLTFFIQNKKIGEASLSVGELTYTITNDRSISMSSLSPTTDSNGLKGYSKEITITNTSSINGILKLQLNRTSGVELSDLRYGIYVNGTLVDVSDVGGNGIIYSNAILGNEQINFKIVLWVKNNYTGSTTTFVGSVQPIISLDSMLAAPYLDSLSNLNNNYVTFNGETWRIKGIENGRMVITKTEYLSSTFTDSHLYNTSVSYSDANLITSMSTDNHALYLKKTVKITGGNGTSTSPYTLSNSQDKESDRQVIATITYKDDGTTVGTQAVYYNETNYISQVLNNPAFRGWSDGTNDYEPGDTVTFTTDTILNSLKEVWAVDVSYDDSNTNFNCDETQCAIEALNNYVS